MTRGIDTESKQKTKKRNFLWWQKDMLDNKRAVESYCDTIGIQNEQEEKKSKGFKEENRRKKNICNTSLNSLKHPFQRKIDTK